MKTNDIKKGMNIKVWLEFAECEVDGIMEDNKRGNTRTVAVKAKSIGFHDEMGSVYVDNIRKVEIEGKWVDVEHTPKQLKAKEMRKSIGF